MWWSNWMDDGESHLQQTATPSRKLQRLLRVARVPESISGSSVIELKVQSNACTSRSRRAYKYRFCGLSGCGYYSKAHRRCTGLCKGDSQSSTSLLNALERRFLRQIIEVKRERDQRQMRYFISVQCYKTVEVTMATPRIMNEHSTKLFVGTPERRWENPGSPAQIQQCDITHNSKYRMQAVGTYSTCRTTSGPHIIHIRLVTRWTPSWQWLQCYDKDLAIEYMGKIMDE